jgi:hypothetical protein
MGSSMTASRSSCPLPAQITAATEMMRNNPGMMSMMENMIGGMSQEQLDAMVSILLSGLKINLCQKCCREFACCSTAPYWCIPKKPVCVVGLASSMAVCACTQAAATGQPRITTEQAKAQVAALKVCSRT